MKAQAVAITIALMLVAGPITAQAAWFCGDDKKEFVETRTTLALLDVFITSEKVIVWGDNGKEMALLKERIDSYKAKILEMKTWAVALTDSCLRDAYLDDLKVHQRIADQAERALEFLKTPRPFQPNS